MGLVEGLNKRANIDGNDAKKPAVNPANLDGTTDGNGTKESQYTDGNCTKGPAAHRNRTKEPVAHGNITEGLAAHGNSTREPPTHGNITKNWVSKDQTELGNREGIVGEITARAGSLSKDTGSNGSK